MLGIDGLVVRAVAVVLGALCGDIGGQGHDADLADGVVECGAGQGEPEGDEAVFALDCHCGFETAQIASGVAFASEPDPVTRFDALARFHEGRPDVGCIAVVQGSFDRHAEQLAILAHPSATARHAGRDHARIVKDEGVAGSKEIGQVAHDPVLEPSLAHHQQPGGIARLDRSQGDTVLGQVEVEIGGLHAVAVLLTTCDGGQAPDRPELKRYFRHPDQ